MSASLLLLAAVLCAEGPADAGLADPWGEPNEVDGGLEPLPFPTPPAPAPLPAPAPAPQPQSQSPAAAPDAGNPEASLLQAPAKDGPMKVHGAAEAEVMSFPSGTPGGLQDLFFNLRPIFGLDAGDDFGIEVGAEFRLRVFDDPPSQRAEDIGGVLRRKDWDEASDFGQILRAFHINHPENSVFWVQAGSVRKKTIGLGHLISRYSNQDNPDYHPASASLGVAYKALSGQLFASDIFGARIFAGEIVGDLGRMFGNSENVYDRFHLGFSAAHDEGQAGYVAPKATLFEFDFDAVLYKTRLVRIMTLVGLGSRLEGKAADLGLVAGLAIDATLEGGFSIGGKLEVRKQSGGFRHGFFGPGYELARFAGTGFSGVPQGLELLPDAFSFYAELHVASGSSVSLDGALEHFTWGRTDADLVFSLAIIDNRLIAGARFTATGLGVSLLGAGGAPISNPRFAMTTEARLRIFSSFYVLASAGTIYFPQPDSTLVRGIYAGAGAGVDFER